MEKKSLKKLLKMLQRHLNDIATLDGTQHVRFAILKKKAKKVLIQIKKDYPNFRSTPVPGVETGALRRNPDQPLASKLIEKPHGQET